MTPPHPQWSRPRSRAPNLTLAPTIDNLLRQISKSCSRHSIGTRRHPRDGHAMANANEPPAQTSPPQSGGRHQIKRSLTELAVPVKLKSGHHSKHPVQQQVRKDRYQDGREPQTAHPGAIRHSLDLPRPDVLSASRRTSAMASRDDDVSRANSKQPSSKGSKDGKLRKELDKTDGRIE